MNEPLQRLMRHGEHEGANAIASAAYWLYHWPSSISLDCFSFSDGAPDPAQTSVRGPGIKVVPLQGLLSIYTVAITEERHAKTRSTFVAKSRGRAAVARLCFDGHGPGASPDGADCRYDHRCAKGRVGQRHGHGHRSGDQSIGHGKRE